jgi:ACT domain-containing protein
MKVEHELPDKELIKKAGVSKGTFYKYKPILQEKGQI